MRTPNKFQLASIAAASILATYVAAAASMQTNSAPRSLDIPPVLLADAAAVDYFLKIEGVDGESTNEGHKDWIEIDSYSWGETNRGSVAAGGGGGAGKVYMQNFNFMKKMDKASPVLMQACAQGEHMKMATLIGIRDGQRQEFLKVTMTDVLISSYRTGGSSGVVPTDQFSINFAKIEYEYMPMNPDGTMGETVRAGWDLATNKKV
jgi:type VI secretion system secreted protein Hcp